MPHAESSAPLSSKQNPHLTYKHNKDQGRHGWLRLTPAYSVRLVNELVSKLQPGARVLDPFSGTATTTLAAAQCGHHAISLDINPFLVWLGNVKLRHYTQKEIKSCHAAANKIASACRKGEGRPIEPPPIFKIERWWSKPTIDALCRIKGLINALRSKPVKDLLTVSFCRTVIESSNAAFNHQSMSFGAETNMLFEEDIAQMFLMYADMVLQGAADDLPPMGKVLVGDSRSLDALADEEPFDAVITSPPYVNRMSYIRELRPYMYWTGFLNEAREAGEIDWSAIGGTWGIATSRLKDWERNTNVPLPSAIEDGVSRIAASEEKNALLMANYVAKYFEDIALHLQAVAGHMKLGSEMHYIVGNSKFYDVVIEAQDAYADLMESAGFERTEIHVIRKRNSKKELFEYDVIAHR